MPHRGPRNDRRAVLFLLGLVLFSPLFLDIFDAGHDGRLFGIPVFYLYLFAAWALLIALVALTTGRWRGK